MVGHASVGHLDLAAGHAGGHADAGVLLAHRLGHGVLLDGAARLRVRGLPQAEEPADVGATAEAA